MGRQGERGSVAVFVAIVLGFLVPAVLYWLVGVTQLRVERKVLVRIVDVANIAAVSEVDPATLWPAAVQPALPESAEQAARDVLRLNLRQVAPLLGVPPDEAASMLRFARDPGSASVRAEGEVPVRFLAGVERLGIDQSAAVRRPGD